MTNPATPNSPAKDEPKDSFVMPPVAAPVSQHDANTALIFEVANYLARVMAEHPHCDHVQVVKHYADIKRKLLAAEQTVSGSAHGRNAQPEQPEFPAPSSPTAPGQQAQAVPEGVEPPEPLLGIPKAADHPLGPQTEEDRLAYAKHCMSESLYWGARFFIKYGGTADGARDQVERGIRRAGGER